MTGDELFSRLNVSRENVTAYLKEASVALLWSAGDDSAGSSQAAQAIETVLASSCREFYLVGELQELVEMRVARKMNFVINVDYSYLGDSGAVTALLECLQIPHTGNSFLSISYMWDKEITKRILSSSGVLTPRAIRFDVVRNTTTDGLVQSLHSFGLHFPVVVKPVASSVSKGVALVWDIEELRPAMQEAGRFGRFVLVEEFIEGVEISVGVLGSTDALLVLPPAEIVVLNGVIQSHDVKFGKDGKKNRIPALLETETVQQCAELAAHCHSVLQANCISRIDAIYREHRFYVLEANANPGLLPFSILPLEARALGVQYEDLVLAWIALSLRRNEA